MLVLGWGSTYGPIGAACRALDFPVIGAQLGLNLDVISTILRTLTGYVISALLFITGNA